MIMAPAPSSSSRGWRRSTSTAGTLPASWASSTRANTGVSLILSRTNSPTPTRRKDSRNGTRQPHERNAASSRPDDSSQKTPVAAKKPTDGPSWGKAAYRPRRLRGACSTASSAAPPHSPPSPMPCRKRSASSSNGAQTPNVPYPGSSPTNAVDSPISSSEATSTDLRPTRSPKCPNTTDPNGRAANATAYVENEASVALTGASVGKNASLRTSAAAVP